MFEWAWVKLVSSFRMEVIKVILVCDGNNLCTLGFISKADIGVQINNARFVGNFAQFIDLYDESAIKAKSQ